MKVKERERESVFESERERINPHGKRTKKMGERGKRKEI